MQCIWVRGGGGIKIWHVQLEPLETVPWYWPVDTCTMVLACAVRAMGHSTMVLACAVRAMGHSTMVLACAVRAMGHSTMVLACAVRAMGHMYHGIGLCS